MAAPRSGVLLGYPGRRAVVCGHAEGTQPEGVTEKRLGPSGARTSCGGEPFGHGADP